MDIINIEFKAKISTTQYSEIKQYLINHASEIIGTDKQVDYYFAVDQGRLKLRNGDIEKSLIYYKRDEIKGLKNSKILLYRIESDPESLLKILQATHRTISVVNKIREIYFIENVKFHLDDVEGLGIFFEVEAISENGKYSVEELERQCNYYKQLFKILNESLIDKSYADMIH